MSELSRSSMQSSPLVAARATLGELNERLRLLTTAGEVVGVGLFLLEIQKFFGPPLTVEQLDEVARTLSCVLRQGDLIAHFEGSTFAIVLTGLTDREDARVVADRARDALPEAAGPWRVRFGLGFLGEGPDAASRAWSAALDELEDKRLVPVTQERHETLRVRSSR